MTNDRFMWTTLVQLGMNMWCDMGNTRGEQQGQFAATPYVRFDRDLWNNFLKQLIAAGTNTIILDIADAMEFHSHPELSSEGAWTQEEMRAELARLNALGIEVIPKLNFSTTHDVWLKEYSLMVSTPTYYQVCRDLIDEVCALFKPRFFHIGMDEETVDLQKNYDYIVVRQEEAWWKDLYFYIDCVERNGARAMMWSDYARHRPDEFVAKCPKSVVQCNWYYFQKYGADMEEVHRIRVYPFELFDKCGYDQLPTGSSVYTQENLARLTEYCKTHISPEHLLGFMQTYWYSMEPENEPRLTGCADALAMAKAAFEAL